MKGIRRLCVGIKRERVLWLDLRLFDEINGGLLFRVVSLRYVFEDENSFSGGEL